MYKQKSFFVCPVCHETGTDNTSLSHWVRSKSGSVVCPTLLGNACAECGDSGHTTKKCLERKREERDLRRSLYQIEAAASHTTTLSSYYPEYIDDQQQREEQREEELKRILSNAKKNNHDNRKDEVHEKEKQIIRVFNVV